MAPTLLISNSSRSCLWSVVRCEVYIFWASFYRPNVSTFPIYFNSHNWNQIGPSEYFNAILFHPTFTLYVMYSGLRSNETICLQSRTCTKLKLNHWNDFSREPTPGPGWFYQASQVLGQVLQVLSGLNLSEPDYGGPHWPIIIHTGGQLYVS